MAIVFPRLRPAKLIGFAFVADACNIVEFKMSNHGSTTPTLVLMAGLPGTGKSKLAYALAEVFDWIVIDKFRRNQWNEFLKGRLVPLAPGNQHLGNFCL